MLSCSVVFAEEGGLPYPKSDELETIVLSDMETYMKLSDPVALDKTQNFLAVANDTTLFVQPKSNPNNSCYVSLLNSEAQDELITKVSIIEINASECKVVALVKNTKTTQSRLIIVDLSDIKNPKLIDNDNYSSIFNITKKDGKLAIVNSGNLILCDISSNEIMEIQSYTMSVGTAKPETFKFIDNIGYILNADTFDLHKCELNGNLCNITTDTLQLGKNINDYYVDDESIYYIDPNFNLVINGEQVVLQDTIFKQLTIFDGNIVTTATTDDKDTTDNGKVYIFDKSGKEISQIASKGNDLYRFDSPQSVFIDGKFIYIADTNNDRIIKRNINNNDDRNAIAVNEKPTKVVAVNEKIYYISSGNLYCSTNNKTAIATNTKSIAAYGDRLLVLSDNKVFAYDENQKLTEFIKNISITADELTSAYQTNFLYLINKQTGQIVKYNLETLTASAPQETIPQCDNYNIDFRGNLFVEKDGIITKFAQENSKFTQISQFSIKGVATNSKISVAIDSINGVYYFVHTNDHLLFEIVDKNNKLGVFGTKNILPPPTEFEIVKAGKTIKDCNAYIAPDNPESAKDVKAGETFLILAKASGQYSESYYYAISSKLAIPVYINKDNITQFEPQTQLAGQKMSPVVSGVQVYKYPYKTAELVKDNDEPIVLSKTDIVTCLHKVAGADSQTNEEIWNWYKITFQAKGNTYTGYVGCNYIAKITQPAHQTDIIFMKTKSPKIGTNIKIYAEASTDSKVLFDNVKDGIDIQIIGTFDPNGTFTQVFYNNTLGYILNENLQANGLTPNQIIAITITSVAVVAFIVLGLLFMHKNKHSKNKSEKPSKDII